MLKNLPKINFVKNDDIKTHDIAIIGARIEQTDSMTHVLNAPSPAATASLGIGETITKTLIYKGKTI